MNGLPYYKAYPRDFIEGTVGMPFELKGAYRIVLDLIYMQGGRLPDDARYISGLLGCSMKKWNGIRDALVATGKLTVSGEFLTNDRADKEVETLRKLQDKQRENRSRPNKIKEIQSPRCDHTEPESEPKNVIHLSQSFPTAARTPEPAGWPELKSAFNGSTEAMLADVQRFMGPMATRENAVNWLTGTVAAYGSQRTARAWTMVIAKAAAGEIVGRPLALWANTAGGMKPETDSQSQPQYTGRRSRSFAEFANQQ